MEKLFELDPYLTHFTACVQSCVQSRKGLGRHTGSDGLLSRGRRTAYDLGTLGGTSVLEVHEPGGPCSPHLRPPAGAPAPRLRGTSTGPAASI